MQKPFKLAILTSGGDSPGMNAAIRAATLLAIARGAEVVGVRAGYKGLLEDEMVPLVADDVSGIIREGGTILGSARSLVFREPAGRVRAREHLMKRGIDGLLVIGGNGSLAGARALVDPAEAPPEFTTKVIGLPASIDNDIAYTGMAIGVDTAMNTIVAACDNISDTASAHDRAFIVEVMGRDSGYLAMSSGIAAAANAVLFRESGQTEEELVERIAKVVLGARRKKGRARRVLVIKAEGVGVPAERLKSLVDARLASDPAIDRTDPPETRVTVLGHIVRGGRPTAMDRILGSRLAHVAVRALLAGKSGLMAAWGPWAGTKVEAGERAEADPQCWLVPITAVLEETERMLDGSNERAKWRKKLFEDISDVLAL